MLGLIFLAYMSSSSLIRTLLMACLGLLLGMIGIDNMTGHFRYSFDLAELGDGIGIVPVAVGLFGLGEILSKPSAGAVENVIAPKLRDLLPTTKEWREAALPIARGTLLGFIIGIIPGSAHIISSFLSYALEKPRLQASRAIRQGRGRRRRRPGNRQQRGLDRRFRAAAGARHPDQPDHRGADRRADDPRRLGRADVGQRASRRVLGLRRLDVCRQSDAAALNLPLVSLFVTVLRIPYAYLYPLIIMFCIIGVYETNNSIVDVWIMLIMGVRRLRAAQVRIRPGAAGARPGDRADPGAEPAPVIDHVERQLLHFLPPADLGRPAGVSARLLALAALSFMLKRADWRAKLAEVEAGEPSE